MYFHFKEKTLYPLQCVTLHKYQIKFVLATTAVTTDRPTTVVTTEKRISTPLPTTTVPETTTVEETTTPKTTEEYSTRVDSTVTTTYVPTTTTTQGTTTIPETTKPGTIKPDTIQPDDPTTTIPGTTTIEESTIIPETTVRPSVPTPTIPWHYEQREREVWIPLEVWELLLGLLVAGFTTLGVCVLCYYKVGGGSKKNQVRPDSASSTATDHTMILDS